MEARAVEETSSQADEHLHRSRKRNERLVYLMNFLHVTTMSVCFGSVFDQHLYDLSGEKVSLVGSNPKKVEPNLQIVSDLKSHEQYELTFEVKVNASQPAGLPGLNWLSLVHMTTGGDCCQEGMRIPALFLEPSTRKLILAMDRPGQPTDRPDYDTSYACRMSQNLEADQWTHLKVKLSSPTMAKGEFNTESDGSVGLFANGELMCENGAYKGRIQSQEGVEVFLGDPWHVSAVAEIRNMLYGKSPSNWVVGLIESIKGMTGLALVIPLGYIADKVNRVSLLRANMLVGCVAAVIIVFALYGPQQDELQLLMFGVVAFATYQQCISGAMVAFLADSVEQGSRYKSMTNYKTSSSLAMGAAPFIQLMLLLSGQAENSWTRDSTRMLVVIGWVLLPFIFLCAMALRRVKSSGHGGHQRGRGGRSTRLSQSWLEEAKLCGHARRSIIPACCESFLILTLLANGMTVRFLPLYFTQVRHFTPVQLVVLVMVCRFVIAFSVQVLRPLGNLLGRSNMVLVLHIASTACLWGMASVDSTLLSAALYIGRFVTLHARDPILSSIVMDTVNPAHRGFWAQFSSLRTASFAGSALLGGWMADRWGYVYSFNVTCIVLLLALPVFLPVVLLFPKSEGAKPSEIIAVDPAVLAAEMGVEEEELDDGSEGAGEPQDIEEEAPIQPGLFISMQQRSKSDVDDREQAQVTPTPHDTASTTSSSPLA